MAPPRRVLISTHPLGHPGQNWGGAVGLGGGDAHTRHAATTATTAATAATAATAQTSELW